mmetsp:Transcript_41514/g.75910  ORF Transcript_41514/g.75910 Transcript_41514/m.75910 type:complete len:263 (-) Transcript_41514:80-868(-)
MDMSSGSYSEFDAHHLSSEQAADPINRRRSINSYPKKIVRSFSGTIDRIQSHMSNNLPASTSTTSAQLRAATARGGISASKEQVDIARAQRERNAIHYHADEAVKAGNAAVVKRDDKGYWIEHDRGNAPVSITNSPSMQQLAALDSVDLNRSNSDNGSKMRMPWTSTFSAKNNATKREVGKNNSLEEKVSEMKQKILQESHNQSGALLNSTAQAPDLIARDRVKMIIEHPEQADAYIRMVLRSDPDNVDLHHMIRMIDYYCN